MYVQRTLSVHNRTAHLDQKWCLQSQIVQTNLNLSYSIKCAFLLTKDIKILIKVTKLPLKLSIYLSMTFHRLGNWTSENNFQITGAQSVEAVFSYNITWSILSREIVVTPYHCQLWIDISHMCDWNISFNFTYSRSQGKLNYFLHTVGKIILWNLLSYAALLVWGYRFSLILTSSRRVNSVGNFPIFGGGWLLLFVTWEFPGVNKEDATVWLTNQAQRVLT